MGSLTARNFGVNSTYAMSGILAIPLLGVIFRELYPSFRSLSTERAIVVFSVVGGASGIASQWIASAQMESLGRNVNTLELLPAVGASVISSALVTYALLPPQPNLITSVLAKRGSLPS